MKFFRILLALLLVLGLLAVTACSGGQASVSPAPPAESGAASSSSEPSSEAGSPSRAPASASQEPLEEPKESEPAEEPEAVEAAGGAVADLTAVVTGEFAQDISGISGTRAGTAAERDSLAAFLSSLKPEKVSLIVIGDPLSGYPDQTLLSDEDARSLVGLAAALPAPGVFETLGNPATGGFLWTLYVESGDQAVRLSDDGFWLTASIKGQAQALVFDSAPCQAASEALGAFLSAQITAAQGNILTLS